MALPSPYTGTLLNHRYNEPIVDGTRRVLVLREALLLSISGRQNEKIRFYDRPSGRVYFLAFPKSVPENKSCSSLPNLCTLPSICNSWVVWPIETAKTCK